MKKYLFERISDKKARILVFEDDKESFGIGIEKKFLRTKWQVIFVNDLEKNWQEANKTLQYLKSTYNM